MVQKNTKIKNKIIEYTRSSNIEIKGKIPFLIIDAKAVNWMCV